MTTENEKNLWRSAQACLGSAGCLSVIMPAYGLESVIEHNIETVCDLLRGNIPFEVLPVDDGSRDGTAEAIRRATTKNPLHVHPVFVKINAGKGNALRRGYSASRGSHVLLLDGDLDLSPSRITTFFDIMAKSRAAIVIGSKRHPDSVIDYPWHRRLASGIYYTIVRLLVGLPISDTQTGMKLFTREALGWAFDRMLVRQFAFDLELRQGADQPFFEVTDEFAHIAAAGLEVQQDITNALTGAVIGVLAAPAAAVDRETPGRQQVRGLSAGAGRIKGRMLQ